MGKEHSLVPVVDKYVGVWKDDKMQGNNGETINELKKKSSITHSDIGSKYDPITKEEIYEWNGIWYLVDGSGPAGQRWKGQGHDAVIGDPNQKKKKNTKSGTKNIPLMY